MSSIRMRFFPFSKPLRELTTADLESLRRIPEGWFIEYKREIPKPRSLAKSVAAFANSEGGWLFLGVDAGSDKRAISFPGVSLAAITIDELEARIRDAILGNCSPAPRMSIRTIATRPTEEGSASDYVVIAVQVHQSLIAPHVHSSGHIYMRFGDSSSPVTDRTDLDRMLHRSDEYQSKIRRLILNGPVCSEAEKEQTVAHFFLSPDPLTTECRSRLKFRRFSAIMKCQPGVFANIFTASDGYVARQVADNNPYLLVATWHHLSSGLTRLSVPLRTISLSSSRPSLDRWLEGYTNGDSFLTQVQRVGFTQGWLIDVNLLLTVLTLALRKHHILMAAGDLPRSVLLAKVRVENTWRRIPFLDLSSYLDYLNVSGVPIIQDDEVFIPRGLDHSSFMRIPIDDCSATDMHRHHRWVLAATPLWIQCLQAMGVYAGALEGVENELFELVTRAEHRHTSRNLS